MAEFNCTCGKVLENSKNGDMVYIFEEQEILAAHQQFQGLALADFLTAWRRWALRENPNVVYWKCPDCGKVYETEFALHGEVLRTFARNDEHAGEEVELKALREFSKIYVLDSKVINEAQEPGGAGTLFDTIYVTRWDYDYFMSPEGDYVLALEYGTEKLAFTYELVKE